MTFLMDEIHSLLIDFGPGRMSSTAYDTAWVARLGELDPDLSLRAMEWICNNQLVDGSWGAKAIYNYHDRVINTLAAMIALTHRGRRASDKARIELGLEALERITEKSFQEKMIDPDQATVGFEMLVPVLMAEAEKLGLILPQHETILGQLAEQRRIKLGLLNGQKINRHLSAALSAEMAGPDFSNILDATDLQEQNGSVANSPSATAYFAAHSKNGIAAAMAYLKSHMLADGGMPFVAPFDVFEPAWVLWNIKLIGELDDQTQKLCEPHLTILQNNWQPGVGIGGSVNAPADGDDTGLAYEVLSAFDYKVDLEAVLFYEEKEYFRCFALERNPSVSANIHILGALSQAGFDNQHPAVIKVLNFLRQSQVSGQYWKDKWHMSPYYTTSHAIINCLKMDRELCQGAIHWMVESQRADGSWGFCGPSSAEETAYCLQALTFWGRVEKNGSHIAIEAGRKWLYDHIAEPYPPLWIGKALYCPQNVVRSAVLSALALTQ